MVVTGSVLDNDTDVDGPLLQVVPQSGVGITAQGGDLVVAVVRVPPAPDVRLLVRFLADLRDRRVGLFG